MFNVVRTVMEPILNESWSRADNALRTLCITQADLSIRWHLRHYGIGIRSTKGGGPRASATSISMCAKPRFPVVDASSG